MKKIKLPDAITSLADIQALAQAGFDNWQHFGEVKATFRGDLLLLDYSSRAHIINRWNYFERVARGLVLNHKTGEIVARPFDKFFYWLTSDHKTSGHITTITEKVDGSLGILFRNNGQYHVTTKGTFFSPQARWATKYLRDTYDLTGLGDEWTLLFEIIYPENRIIVDYGDKTDLVLLAARNRFTGAYLPFFPDLYTLSERFGFTLPRVFNFNSVDDIIAATSDDYDNFEGWIAEFSDGMRFKFKTDRYLEIHRYIRELDFASVLNAVREDNIDYILNMMPDENLGSVYEWVEHIRETVAHINAKTVQAFVNAPRRSSAEYEAWIQQHHPQLTRYLMALWQGKDIEPLIYAHAFTNGNNS